MIGLAKPPAPQATGPVTEEVDEVGEANDADFERFYLANRLEFVRLARLLVDDLATAEDVTQEAFAGFYRRRGQLTDPSKYRAYVRTSVINGARTAMRRRRTHGSLLHRLFDPGPSPTSETVLAGMERDQVLTALAGLPSRQREVLVLRYYLDLPELAIARELGIGVGTVKSSASRGLATLRREMGERDG